jgi:GT2 family glycosyltransferase
MIRSEVLRKLGSFEEKFFMYFEDLEFSLRLNSHYRIVYVPESRVYHKVGAGTRWSSYTPLYSYYYTRNRLWYFKNESPLYRIYVVAFSIVNVIAKSMVIMFFSLLKSENGEMTTGKSLSALWRGLKDGLFPRDTESK